MNTKNLPIILGILLPVVFIVIMFFVVSAPFNKVNPEHNFIYIFDNSDPYYYQYKNTYELSNGKVISKTLDIPKDNAYNSNRTIKDYPTMYIHDVKNDTSREITLSDAQKYELISGPSSPDGYTVGYVYGSFNLFDEILLGGGSRNNGYYITKGNLQKKLNMASPYTYYTGNFRIIGWVK